MEQLIVGGSGTSIGYPVEQLRRVDTETLKSELVRALSISADHLCYMAAIWQELEARGVDLSDLRSGLAVYLPLIATRKLDAEAVVKFAGNRTLLNAVADLPIDEQRRLAQGGLVEIASEDGVVRQIPAIHLRGREIKIALAPQRIRPAVEQTNIILAARKPKKIGVSLQVTAAEMEHIKAVANALGKPVSTVVYDALKQSDLFSAPQ